MTKKALKKDTLVSRVMSGLNDAVLHARGDEKAAIAHVPPKVDVKSIRASQGLSQALFASRYGFTAGAVRDWEQGRRQPERAARILLTIIAREPDVVDRVIAASSTAAIRAQPAKPVRAGTTKIVAR